MKKLLIALCVFLLISCVAEKKPNLINTSVRINDIRGLSILPPQEPGWTIEHRGDNRVVFGKVETNPYSTHAIHVILIRLPKIKSKEHFLQYVSKGKDAQQPIERFEAIKINREVISDQSNYCVKFHDVVKDKKARTPSGMKPMILEVIGKTCQHPKNKTIGVDFGYSYRYPTGSKDPELEQKAKAFLKEVQFTDF